MMRAGSLFTGIGGLDLGLSQALGCEPAFFCEVDKHCIDVLGRHWPDVPIVTDVRDTEALLSKGRVDVLHGGYPCQPFSQAGMRRGEEDPRHLWPAFAAAIRTLRPSIVVGENVAGHLTLGFDSVLCDLSEMGFDVRWGVVRASDAGAPHRRARLFWVATNTQRQRSHGERREDAREKAAEGINRRANAQGHRPSPPNPNSPRPQGKKSAQRHNMPSGGGGVDWGKYQESIKRWERIHGPSPIPIDDNRRLRPEFVEWMMGFPAGWTEGRAKTNRLRMLGNSVVPHQAALATELLLSK